MSADNQNVAAELEDAVQVLDLKQAGEIVQAMEARGDFKFRGIIKIYDLVRDWSAQFKDRGILPSLEQLQRDTDLPEDTVRRYLLELMARGSSKQHKILFALPALQFIAGAGARLSTMTVFCRPTEQDGTTARRYVGLYNERNAQALAKYIESRNGMDPKLLREQALKAIQAGKVRESQARAEIIRLCNTEFDDSPERRKINYNLFARPTIQKLIEERKLLYLQNDSPDGRKINGVYFPGQKELEERFKALADYFLRHIVQEGPPNMDELDPKEIVEKIRGLGARIGQMADTEKQIIDDLWLISPAVVRTRKEQQEQTRKQGLEQALEQLSKFPRPAEPSAFRNVSDETLAQLRNVNGVLSCEYPLRGRLQWFYLHKNQVPEAVKQARDAFDKNEDETPVLILSAMGLERYLDKDQYKAFLDLEQRVLFDRLPLVVRVWRALFGKGKLDQKEIVKMKGEVQKEQEAARARIREEEAKAARKKLISERREQESQSGGDDGAAAKAKQKKSDAREGGGFEAPEEESEEEKYQKVMEEERARELLKKIVDILDKAWQEKQLPNREYLVTRLSEVDEDQLIMFLKKYGRKEVLSFRINHEKPEYVWPILISRRYLRRFGRSLYNRVKEEADKQRKASMPNQEKFDVSTSIEDFLARILPKL